MTEQTKRALERLPGTFYFTVTSNGAAYQDEAAESLAARSPQLLAALEDAITAFRAMERLFGSAPWSSEIKIVAAEALLRETTRAILAEK